MSLNDNAKKLAEYVSGVIEKEKQEAYQTGYTKGYDKAWKEAETIHVKGLMEWMRLMEVHYDSKPKDAPSAMDTMPVAPEPCVKGHDVEERKGLLSEAG